MQILLACAKIMEKQTAVKTPTVSIPLFQREAEHFALLMSQRPVEELMDMFKSCRGAMTRFIIKNQLSMPDDLRHFEYEGFEFASEYGDAGLPYFIIA